MNVAADCIRAQIIAILSAWKMKPEMAEITADVLVDADLAGIDSHGSSILMLYEEKLRAGILQVQAEPRIVRENVVTALIDAGAGLGHTASVMAARLAADKAEANGIGAISVTNSHHFGIAGYYAKIIADRGLIGLVASNSRAISVVPTRAATRVFGTNPLAFAAPARRNPPFLLDMSTSTVAGNKIKMYAFKNKPLPPGWVLDENGQPVIDAALARQYLSQRERGGLTPVGGTPDMSSHKGYGLAMMVQILGSTLAGGSFPGLAASCGKQKVPDNIGHFFQALDPKAFRPEGAFEDDLDEMIDFLHGAPAVDPSLPVLVAGDPELQSREQRSREGVPIPEILFEKIREIAQRCGAPFLFGDAATCVKRYE